MAGFIEEARRAQIVAAAIAVLARDGYAKASLSRIAEEAGISKSVISYHFAGKDEMFEAVYRHVEEAAGAYMTPFIERAGDPAAQLWAYLRHQIGYMGSHRDELLAIGMIAMNHTRDGQPPDYITRGAASERDILVSLIKAGQAQGQFRQFSAPVMAAMIAKAVESALTEWAWRPETDLEAYADELVALFSRGMAKGGND